MNSILTVPNLLTFMRMALIPVFASLLYYGYSHWALFVFVVAGVSDGIDGFLARKFNQESELGTIIDPIADKLLMTTAFIILTMPNVLPAVRHLPVPFWVTAAVIGRDVLIITVAGAINIMTGFSRIQTVVAWKAKHACPGNRGRDDPARRRDRLRILSTDDLLHRRPASLCLGISLRIPHRKAYAGRRCSFRQIFNARSLVR
jgi:CDP-diacylglycerol--glycerol-3-phosphate 3-phosphatidyltransferase